MAESTACAGFFTVGACVFGSSDPESRAWYAPSNCAWIFDSAGDDELSSVRYAAPSSRAAEGAGRCFEFKECNLPGFDAYGVLQFQPIETLALNTTQPWLVSLHNDCLALTSSRRVIFWVSILAALVAAVLVPLTFSALFRGAHESSPRALRGAKCLASATVLLLLVMGFGLGVYSAVIATNDAISNIALLPSFAILIIGLEGLHFFPAFGRAFEATKAVIEVERARATRTLLFRTWVEVGLPACVLYVCTAHILSMAAQFACSSDIQAVTLIAWFDVFAALAQSCLLAAGISGHMHFPAPWKATPWVVSGSFFVLLLGLGVNMNMAYSPPSGIGPLEQFGATATLRDYERYEAKVAGWAYNLAFVSMLRTLALTGLHTMVTVVEFKPKRRPHGSSDGGQGVGEILERQNPAPGSTGERAAETGTAAEQTPLLRL